jgi:hypothetical protein
MHMPGRNGTPNEEQHGIEAEVIAVELKAAFKLPDTQAVIRLVKHRRRLGRQGRLSRSDTGRSAGRAGQVAVTLGNTDGDIVGLTISDPPTQTEVQALRSNRY